DGFLVDRAVLIDQVVDVETTLEVFDVTENLSAIDWQAGKFSCPDFREVIGLAVLHILVEDIDDPAFRPQRHLYRLVVVQEHHRTPNIERVVPRKVVRDDRRKSADEHRRDKSDAAIPAAALHHSAVHGATSISRRISVSSASTKVISTARGRCLKPSCPGRFSGGHCSLQSPLSCMKRNRMLSTSSSSTRPAGSLLKVRSSTVQW